MAMVIPIITEIVGDVAGAAAAAGDAAAAAASAFASTLYATETAALGAASDVGLAATDIGFGAGEEGADSALMNLYNLGDSVPGGGDALLGKSMLLDVPTSIDGGIAGSEANEVSFEIISGKGLPPEELPAYEGYKLPAYDAPPTYAESLGLNDDIPVGQQLGQGDNLISGANNGEEELTDTQVEQDTENTQQAGDRQFEVNGDNQIYEASPVDDTGLDTYNDPLKHYPSIEVPEYPKDPDFPDGSDRATIASEDILDRVAEEEEGEGTSTWSKWMKKFWSFAGSGLFQAGLVVVPMGVQEKLSLDQANKQEEDMKNQAMAMVVMQENSLFASGVQQVGQNITKMGG